MSDYDWHWWTGPKIYGCKVNQSTDEAIRLAYALSGMQFPLTQGSTFGSGSGASASAGTHNGTSVVDFSVTGKTIGQIKTFVTWLRKLGFAAWYRPAIRGLWPPHIHAILIGTRGVAQGAVNQIYWFKRRRTGLVGNAFDNIHPWVGWTTWPEAKKKYATSNLTPATSTSKEGQFGMAEPIRRVRNKDIRLKAGKWTNLPVDDKGLFSLISGPTKDFNLNVQAEFAGLPLGSVVQLRCYSVNYKKGADTNRIWSAPPVEVVGTGGATFGQAIFDNSLGAPPKGWSRRLRIEAFTLIEGVSVTTLSTSVRKA